MTRFLEEQIDFLKLNGVYEKYLHNCKIGGKYMLIDTGPYKNCYLNNFEWSETKEGFLYWKNICLNLKRFIYNYESPDLYKYNDWNIFPDIK